MRRTFLSAVLLFHVWLFWGAPFLAAFARGGGCRGKTTYRPNHVARAPRPRTLSAGDRYRRKTTTPKIATAATIPKIHQP